MSHSRPSASGPVVSRAIMLAGCVLLWVPLLIGGSCGDQLLPPPDTTPIPGGGAWRTFKPVPEPLHEAAVAVLDGQLYMIGGRGQSGPVASLYRYDPVADTWTQLASHPGTPVDHMGAAVVDGILYAFGGTIEFPGPSVNGTYAYDPATNQWSTRSPMPVTVGVMGVGVVNGRIYCIGGLSDYQTSDFVLEYEPATNAWTDLTAICPIPTPRDHFMAATVDGRIHCIGGRQTTIESILDVHEVFDPATRTWETKAALPTARGGFAAAVLNGRILIMGGEGADNSVGVFAENEEYDPVTDTWHTLSPMITPRHSAQAGVIDNVVYVPAGAAVIGRTFTNVNEGFSFGF